MHPKGAKRSAPDGDQSTAGSDGLSAVRVEPKALNRKPPCDQIPFPDTLRSTLAAGVPAARHAQPGGGATPSLEAGGKFSGTAGAASEGGGGACSSHGSAAGHGAGVNGGVNGGTNLGKRANLSKGSNGIGKGVESALAARPTSEEACPPCRRPAAPPATPLPLTPVTLAAACSAAAARSCRRDSTSALP